jgi:signal transduction histidine kinase
MPDGGTLTVTARPAAGVWAVTIRDEGRGMTPEERDRLFTPFAHSSPGGTGLGLAIVYRIVEEHGGTIRVHTVPGGGTTITITLPAPTSSPAAGAASIREVA